MLSFCGGWGLHSHFHVQPNYSVAVVLRCVVVGVVTIAITMSFPVVPLKTLYRGCEKV